MTVLRRSTRMNLWGTGQAQVLATPHVCQPHQSHFWSPSNNLQELMIIVQCNLYISTILVSGITVVISRVSLFTLFPYRMSISSKFYRVTYVGYQKTQNLTLVSKSKYIMQLQQINDNHKLDWTYLIITLGLQHEFQ